MTRPISPKNAIAMDKPLSWRVWQVFNSGAYLALGQNGQEPSVEKQWCVRLEAVHDSNMRCSLNGDERLFKSRFGGVPAKGETLTIEMRPTSGHPSRITEEVTALFANSEDEGEVTTLVRAPKAPQPA